MAADEWGDFAYAVLPIAELFVDPAYQRPLSTFAKRIEEHFDPLMVGTVIVSDRGENKRTGQRFAVIDGQTRVHGMEANDFAEAPCLVYVGLTRQQEAELFARLQTERRGMATWIRFRAALVSKKPEALAIAALTRSEGWKMAGDGDERGIRSIAGVEWLYRKEPELLTRTLRVITAAWGAQDLSTTKADPRVRGEILQGIGRFLFWEQPDADDARLARNLSAMTPDQLRHRANALREGQGASSAGNFAAFISDALIGVYASRPSSRAA